jgi:hypothetical protein
LRKNLRENFQNHVKKTIYNSQKIIILEKKKIFLKMNEPECKKPRTSSPIQIVFERNESNNLKILCFFLMKILLYSVHKYFKRKQTIA